MTPGDVAVSREPNSEPQTPDLEHLLVSTLAREMRANPKIVLIHGDPGPHADHSRGGSAYRDLRSKFSAERVRHTQASAAALVSAALGAALCGYRPVVELPSPDDLPFALDSLATGASRSVWLSAGGVTAPLVLRILTGSAGRAPNFGVGAGGSSVWGSHAWEAWCAHVPGLLVAAPSLASDACGLLRSALKPSNENPVLMFEYPELYTVTGDTAVTVPDLPFGVARMVRRGKDLTVVGYGSVIRKAAAACEQASAQFGLEAELIDLRTLTPLDLVCVLESLKKTGRLLLCADAPASGGFTSELAMRVMEHGFDDLDAPIRRVCALDVPVSTPAALASQADLLKALKELADA